jgi:hypothetical protein
MKVLRETWKIAAASFLAGLGVLVAWGGGTSTRGLLGAVIVAAGCGWLGWQIDRAREDGWDEGFTAATAAWFRHERNGQ